MMHRFFVSAGCIQQDAIVVSGKLLHQLRHVLRLGKGDSCIFLDNCGWEYEAVIDRMEKNQARTTVQKRRPAGGEPQTRITLYQGWLKGSKFELVLQKGTEIGVSAFVPLLCQRSVAIPTPESQVIKLGRWQAILQEAAEQSGRGMIPTVQPAMLFSGACSSVGCLSLLPWEQEQTVSVHLALKNKPKHRCVNLFIGPEGGFSPEEVELARNYGIRTVTLGPRLLRAETAGLVAATLILNEYNELEVPRPP